MHNLGQEGNQYGVNSIILIMTGHRVGIYVIYSNLL